MKVVDVQIIFLIFIRCWNHVLSICTWPSMLQNSTWLDSDKGTITYTDTEMTGWSVVDNVLQAQPISSWDCFHQVQYASHYIVIYKAKSTVTFHNGVFRAFICMKIYEATSSSFYYYQLSAPDINHYKPERITVDFESVTSSISTASAESILCISEGTNAPSVNEYHMLVRQGMEVEATQICDSSFFGRYWYNVSKDESTWTCNETSSWDVCSNKQYMVFDYSQCPTIIADSDTGEVRCLLSIYSGFFTLQTVLSTGNTTNKFTCILSSLDETSGSVSASIAPGSCKEDQTPDTVPVIVLGSGSTQQVGQVVKLFPQPDGLCPLTTTSTTTTSAPAADVPTAAIVGSVLGTLALIALIVLLIVACKSWNLGKKCLSDRKRDEKTKSKRRFKFLDCWKPAMAKEKAASTHEDTGIEELPHKRYPHFIHEQPATAPSLTALDQEERNSINKSAPIISAPKHKPKGRNKVPITPVEAPDTTGKSSKASMSTINSLNKHRNVSSVNLSVASDTGSTHYAASPIRDGSTSKTSRKSIELMNESFNNESIGRVSSLSKYLNSTQESFNHDDNLLDETIATPTRTHNVTPRETLVSNNRAFLGLKPIFPISASESFLLENPLTKQSSNHDIVQPFEEKREWNKELINHNPPTKCTSLPSSQSQDPQQKLLGKNAHKRRRNSGSSSRSSKTSETRYRPPSSVNMIAKSPVKSLNSGNTISSEWTTVDEETVTNSSKLSLPTRKRTSNSSSASKHQASRSKSENTSSSQWTTVGEETVTNSSFGSVSRSTYKSASERYPNKNNSTNSTRNLNSANTHSSQWTTVDEDTVTNSTVESLQPQAKTRLTYHPRPKDTDQNSILSISTSNSDIYSASAKNNIMKGISKINGISENSQSRLDNSHPVQVQGTQTDISSLEVFFQAHGYPDQVFPRSVKSGLYYISDSPLEPIKEAPEHTTVSSKRRNVSDERDYKLADHLKLHSENTFSSQWTTVDEETATESTDESGLSTDEQIKNEQKEVTQKTRVKTRSPKEPTLPFYRTRTYNGYEPDSD